MVELPLALGGVIMDILKVIVTVVYVLICIALVIVVLMQEGKSAGLGAIGGGTSETYWGKNKGRSMEGALEKFTKGLAVAFILLSVILNLL